MNLEAIRQHLDKILSSAAFKRNHRLSCFLRLAVERHLDGRDHELKESVIGTEVFGRKPDYDPKADGVVRTEARRLRALLNEYYLNDGNGDAIVIELPKGGYVPLIRFGAAAPDASSLLRSSRKTEPGAKQFLTRLAVRTAPFALPGKWNSQGWPIVVLAGFVAGVGLLIWWQLGIARARIPIAVLPLENLSHDPSDDYFADGLTDELIRNLAIIDGLAPRSRTSSFAFRGKQQNVREVGRQLGVDYVLEGSVLHSDRRLRIDAQLIRVRDDFPLWSGRFDRDLTDVFAIQDEISRGIVNSLRLKLGRGQRRYETNTEAYDLYLRARSLVIQRGLRGLNESVDPYEKAIARDPSFAPAYAGLATARAARSGEVGFDLPDELGKMRALPHFWCKLGGKNTSDR